MNGIFMNRINFFIIILITFFSHFSWTFQKEDLKIEFEYSKIKKLLFKGNIIANKIYSSITSVPSFAAYIIDEEKVPCLNSSIEEVEIIKLINILEENPSKIKSEVKIGPFVFKNESEYNISIFKDLVGEFYFNKILDQLSNLEYKTCDKVLCQIQNIFGTKVGLRIFFLMKQYNINTSYFSSPSLFIPWTEEDLNVIIESLSDVPLHLRSSISGYKILRLPNALSLNEEEELQMGLSVVAWTEYKKREIRVKDSWAYYDRFVRRLILFHELGHAIDNYGTLSSTEIWLQSGQWTRVKENGSDSFIHKSPSKSLSQYKEDSPVEDFAESFVLYRYDATRFKQIYPKQYEFLRNLVFGGKEYENEKACHSKSGYINENYFLFENNSNLIVPNFNQINDRCGKGNIFDLMELKDDPREMSNGLMKCALNIFYATSYKQLIKIDSKMNPMHVIPEEFQDLIGLSPWFQSYIQPLFVKKKIEERFIKKLNKVSKLIWIKFLIAVISDLRKNLNQNNLDIKTFKDSWRDINREGSEVLGSCSLWSNYLSELPHPIIDAYLKDTINPNLKIYNSDISMPLVLICSNNKVQNFIENTLNEKISVIEASDKIASLLVDEVM